MNNEHRLRVMRAYRALFLADDGKYTRDGELVIRDLEKATGWMNTSMPFGDDGHTDPLQLAALHGKRGLFTHIKLRLFEPLEKYNRKAED